MARRQDLLRITTADFIARSAYQMGKTPLLPLFALTLGASDLYLGFIVSVSTLTGMVLKPLVGALSDYGGRLRWLLIGTFFFVFMPFTYQFIQTPEHLLVVRLIHGVATAVYGPVTLAYVIEQGQKGSAERLGWFSLARSGGYIVGPLLGGVLLTVMNPVDVFTVMGLLSCLIFVPLLRLPQAERPPRERIPLRTQLRGALRAMGHDHSVWLAGGVEFLMYIATYTLKTFLPLYAVGIGVPVILVGLFFSVQELVTIVVKPVAGRLADRVGYLPTTLAGMGVLGVALILLPLVAGYSGLILLPSIVIGVAQALITTAATAYVGERVEHQHLGASLGFIGALDNTGKVAGPLVAGLLMTRFTFTATVELMGIGLLIAVLMVVFIRHVYKSNSMKSRGASQVP